MFHCLGVQNKLICPWVCGRSLTGTVGSNLAGCMDVSHVSLVCSQVEVSATGRSLVQRSPADCVCECDQEQQ